MGKGLRLKLNQSTLGASTTSAFSAIDSQLKKLKEKWAPKKLASVPKRQAWTANRYPRENDAAILGGSTRLKGLTRLSPTPALVGGGGAGGGGGGAGSRMHTHSSVNELSPARGNSEKIL